MSWNIGDTTLTSRFLMGSARFPSLRHLQDAITQSKTQIVTLSLRREQSRQKASRNLFWELLRTLPVKLLPNTAGCRSAKEAILTAQLSRELFGTSWIKLEVIGDEQNLIPDPFALVEAARVLCADGFEVFPFTTDDLVLAERLLHSGCRILMPWASPIGTGRGVSRRETLENLRLRLPNTPLIVDAGLGRPSDAALCMEMDFDAVLVNTAVSDAENPALMAQAFAQAVKAGRSAYHAGLIGPRPFATPSSPTVGIPFWENRL